MLGDPGKLLWEIKTHDSNGPLDDGGGLVVLTAFGDNDWSDEQEQ